MGGAYLMGIRLTAAYGLDLPAALHKFGCSPILVAGWENLGYDLTRIDAHLSHHTAGAATGYAPSLNVVRNGRGGTQPLAGPLAQTLQPRAADGDTSVYVIAAGKANHAGAGLWSGADSNYECTGNEAELVGDGSDLTPWRLEMMCRIAAAFLWLGGQPASAHCRHAEYALPAGRKPDVTGVHGDWLRARTDEILRIGGGGSFTNLEDDMPTIACVDVAVDPNEPRRGYKLLSNGSIIAFAHQGVGAPPVLRSPELDLVWQDWRNRNIAPAIKLVIDPTSWGAQPKGWVYDSTGGIVPVGGAPQSGATAGWWPNSFLRPQPVV